jgi:hypothetical protein
MKGYDMPNNEISKGQKVVHYSDDGRVYEGKVKSVSGWKVNIKVKGGGTLTVPAHQIETAM